MNEEFGIDLKENFLLYKLCITTVEAAKCL